MNNRLLTAVALILCTLSISLPARPSFAGDVATAALTVSNRALKAYRAGRYKEAATLYRAAYHTHPDELTYLYNAARAAQLAGLLKDSERDYVAYLIKAQPGSPAMKKARVHLAEVRAALRGQREAVAKARKPAPAQPAPVDGKGQRVAGWTLLGIGLAAGVGGGFVLTRAVSDQDALDAKLAQKDKTGKITGISKTAADQENKRITNQLYLGWGLVAGGVVGLGVGAILVATAPRSRVALTPWAGGRGASVLVRF